MGFRYATNDYGTLPNGWKDGWNVSDDRENVSDSPKGIAIVGPRATGVGSGYADYVRRSFAVCGARVSSGKVWEIIAVLDGHEITSDGIRTDTAQNFELYSTDKKLLVKYNPSTSRLSVARAAGDGFDEFTIDSAVGNSSRNYGQSVGEDGGLTKEVSLGLLNSAKTDCGGINIADLKTIKNTMVGAAVVSGVGAAGNIVATGFNVANAVKKPSEGSATPGESEAGDETAKPADNKNPTGTVNTVTAGVGAATGTASAVMSGVSAGKLDKIIEQFEKCQNAVKAL